MVAYISSSMFSRMYLKLIMNSSSVVCIAVFFVRIFSFMLYVLELHKYIAISPSIIAVSFSVIIAKLESIAIITFSFALCFTMLRYIIVSVVIITAALLLRSVFVVR